MNEVETGSAEEPTVRPARTYGADHRSLASVCGQQVESGGRRGSVREGNSRDVVHGQAAAGEVQVQSLSLYEDGRAQILLWDMAARLLAPGISTLGTSQFQYFSSTPSIPWLSICSFVS